MLTQNKLKLAMLLLIIFPAYAFGIESYSVYKNEDSQYNDHRYFIFERTYAIKDDEGTDFIITSRNPLQDIFAGKVDKDEPIYDDGSTILMQATYLNDVATVEKLLDMGVNPNVKNLKQGNMTALMIATARNYSTIVKLLVKHKSNLNQVTIGGMSALLIACQKGYLELARELIGLGADVNQISMNQVSKQELTPLMLAASKNNDGAVSLLIENSANLDLSTEEYGETALMIAVAHRHCSTIKILLNAGANRNIKNKLGYKAEDYIRLKIGIKKEDNCMELFNINNSSAIKN